ncbi:MAG: shikimate dehydrogenase [Nitrospira sp.]|nr:shikimate dehydrogenase [Nitrospira sp.]
MVLSILPFASPGSRNNKKARAHFVNIDAHTQFCGVIGNPVEHSLSPAIHNAAFQRLGLNIVYLAWRVESIGDAIRGLRTLGNFRGASVTIPHKVGVMPLLDHIEPVAGHIGAVNTIVADKGALTGCNTDATGALRALREGGAPLKDESVVVLGSGGAARAIAFALAGQADVSRIHLLGIEEQERVVLAGELRDKTAVEVSDAPLEDAVLRRVLPDVRVLIHCTPVGMTPKIGLSCVPSGLLHRDLTVMDIVYNPRNTQLLKDAAASGCRIIAGLEMFLYQAAAQFELWTGRPAPIDVMRGVLESRFS